MQDTIRKIFCLILTCFLLVHVNYIALYYGLYLVNVTSLTENYCEKKKECCNAQCYLEKKMNEETNTENQNTQATEIKLKITEFEITSFIPLLNSSNDIKFFNLHFFIPSDNYRHDIDHPPRS